ncbi:MAG: hypothetical protein JWO83_4100 [Caulobacteraceae bacterium]|nr:hypothetical protein [Caulobacteraceae bacterium]
MARIRFIGDSDTCAWLGVGFLRGEWVADHNLSEAQLARVIEHPHFEVEAAQKPAKRKA